ncbi:hypothetical protein BASA81_013751 [Batrachochytrium salamandrivorans]|nr:hypothetical protein BASA81_013751 [Batrachochytrium salamandrivorans]
MSKESLDLFGGLSVKPEPAKPAASGFAFMAAPPPSSSSGFSFLSPAPAPAAAAASPSVFGFLSPASPNHQPPIQPSPSISSSAEPRKRRPAAKRPGHARESAVALGGGEVEPSDPPVPTQLEPVAFPEVVIPQPQQVPIAPPPQQVPIVPPPPSSSSSYSVLAGLTVYVPEEEEEQVVAAEPEAPAVVAAVAPRSFALEMEALANQQLSLSQAKHGLLEEQSRLRAVLHSLDEQQQDATLREDFDLAQVLQGEIDQSQSHLAGQVALAGEMDLVIAKLQAQREDVLHSQHLELEILCDKFTHQTRALEGKLGLFQQQTKAEQDSAWQQLEQSEAALHTKLEQCQGEETSALEELQVVSDRRAQLSVDSRKELGELMEGKLGLEQEIQVLELALKQKLDELAGVNLQVKQVEDKITQNESKYGARSAEVDARVQACRENAGELAQAKQVLDDKRAALTDMCATQADTVQAMQASALEAKENAEQVGKLFAVSNQFRQQRQVWKQLSALDGNISDGGEEGGLSANEQALAELDSELKRIDLLLQQDNKLAQNNALVEEMETQKQLAVQLRNFKEAGRLAAEIKSLTQKRTEALGRMDEYRIQVEEKNSARQALVLQVGNGQRERETRLHLQEQQRLVVLRETRSRFLEMVREAGSGAFALDLLSVLQGEIQLVEEAILLCGGEIDGEVVVEEAAVEVLLEDDPLSMEALDELLSEAIGNEDFDLAEAVSGRIDNKRAFLEHVVASGQTVEVVEQPEIINQGEDEQPVEEEDVQPVEEETAQEETAQPVEEETAQPAEDEAAQSAEDEAAQSAEDETAQPTEDEAAQPAEEEAVEQDVADQTPSQEMETDPAEENQEVPGLYRKDSEQDYIVEQ